MIAKANHLGIDLASGERKCKDPNALKACPEKEPVWSEYVSTSVYWACLFVLVASLSSLITWAGAQRGDQFTGNMNAGERVVPSDMNMHYNNR